ncbi:galactose-specific lectin nattectin-like [Stigmatopora nigra]
MVKMTFSLHFLLLLFGISGMLTKTRASVLYRDKECPPDWTRLDCRCIRFINEPLRFSLAETFCNLLGGNLVSIHNALENEVVRQVINAGAGSFVRTWIGIHDRIVEGEYLSVDGTIVDFFDWSNNRPRPNIDPLDCVEINFPGNNQWSDRNCNGRLPFVCARDVSYYKHGS